MTAPAAQRYTDLDLRIDPTLTGIAVRYAREYLGDWEVMTAARDLALAAGSLPVPVARMVLNVARCDARWVDLLPSPQRHTFVGAFPSTGSGSDDDEDDEYPETVPRPRRRLEVVRAEPEYRPPYDLPTNWKMRYGRSASGGPGAQKRVWHVLDPERSRVRYFPHPRAVERYHTILYWVCGSSPRLPVLSADPPDDLPMCKSCQRYLEFAEYEDWRPELRAWWLAEQERLTAPDGGGA